MFKNSNTASVKKLSDRSLKANKTRNIFAILAIVLTTVLFITVTTIAASLIENLNFEKFRKVGTIASGFIKNPSKDEIESLKSNSLIKSVGEVTQVANLVGNLKLDKAKISLCYLDNEALGMRVYDDLKGTWPSKEEEIALPTWILDKLGLPYTLGQKISLSYEEINKNETPVTTNNNNSNNKKTKEFILSAYYIEYTNKASGDKGFGVVSKEFKDSLGGVSDLYINLKKNDSISEDKVCSDAGISKDRFKVNPAYQIVEQKSLSDILPYFAIVLIILACGYLLIYNIFYISVTKDIKFYGLLKTIGTTSKQLKVIIRKQCLKLCVIGIPIGLAIGYGIGFIIVPLALKGANVSAFKVSFNPLIFIITVMFTLVTVILGCRKPAKIAGKVSPIEALKYSAVGDKRKKTVKKGSKGAKLHRMALANIFRDKKRALIVILSLSLGFICFICGATFSKSLQADAYLSTHVPYDFRIDNELIQGFRSEKKENDDFLDDEVYEKIKKIEGIEDISRVKYFRTQLQAEGPLKKNLEESMKADKNNYNSNDTNVIAAIMGVKGNAFNKMDGMIVEGTIDKTKFESGKYAVISHVNNNAIKIGDKVNIGTKDNPKEVEIMAIVSANPFLNGYFVGSIDVFIDNSLLKELYPEAKTVTVVFDIKGNDNEAVYSKLKEVIGVTSNVNIKAKHIEKQDFIKMQKGMFIAAGSIAMVIAFIGALNFINTMITSINARKVELAMLQSVGMTKKQMKNMITLEGIYYGGISLLIVATLGNVMAYYLIEAFKNEASYAKYYFPTMPLLGIAIFVVAMSILVPKVIFRATLKESVVDRLRDVN